MILSLAYIDVFTLGVRHSLCLVMDSGGLILAPMQVLLSMAVNCASCAAQMRKAGWQNDKQYKGRLPLARILM